jgi:hypothetical protein
MPPARKKPRLEEPLPTATDEAARRTASPDASVVLPPPADNDETNRNADPVTSTQPNAGANRRWTVDEDAKLMSAITNTSKMKWGNEYKTNWAAVAALVPGRTRLQCRTRYRGTLVFNIDPTTKRVANWTADEDKKLKDAVQTHDGKNWAAIAALVPGRTLTQCSSRWHHALDPSIDRANGRTGKWTAVEDSDLKDAVQTHDGKNGGAIAALVPGRSRIQCCGRWRDKLDPSLDRASGRKGKWTVVEDSKLKDTVQTHGANAWVTISALVPGRTKEQCRYRWKKFIDPNHSGWTQG